MTAAEYIAEKKQKKTTMCAAILYPDGTIEECVKSHLKTLMLPYGDKMWDEIPKDDSPLFWMTAYTGVVLIDYENQIYSEGVTKEQEVALDDMYDAEILLPNPMVIHCGNRILNIEKTVM